jgi:hypothetical protein
MNARLLFDNWTNVFMTENNSTMKTLDRVGTSSTSGTNRVGFYPLTGNLKTEA